MNTKHKIINSTPIHYYVSGENHHNCILFVHPAFADHRAFDKQIELFSKKYKIITVDLLGHGQSQNIKTNGGIDNTSEHIKEILEIEGVQKLHLVGVSIGSLLLQDFANKYPDKVLSLCAVGGYDINNYDKGIEKEQGKQQLAFMLKALISIKWFSQSNALITAITKKAQKDFYEMNKLFKRRSFKYMATLEKIMNQFQTQRNYPLLLLCGESDNELAIKLSKQWNKSEENSVYYTISKAGHCANMDNPIEFNTVLMKFLDGCTVAEK
ncbi:MAG: alpha/beta fold hydrolase [Mobilitalea sp.]